ncbi:hypothetical protein STEG23_005975, partial [Scotinomys teguina]
YPSKYLLYQDELDWNQLYVLYWAQEKAPPISVPQMLGSGESSPPISVPQMLGSGESS